MRAAYRVCLITSALLLGAAGPLRYWHLTTGPDGNTKVEHPLWPPKMVKELGSSHDIFSFFSEHASSMIVISGKPGWLSPVHNVGKGREIVAVLAGSSIGHFANGQTQTFGPGDIVLIEDQDSKGRAIEFGKDGYLAVTVTLDPTPP